ncbi:hypothetical protein ABE189_03105 [Bacillus subtilis]|uniref:hypothetical protein n=1 Tax=Bacillus subtilis group TaxID=653685 RepID=UPI0005A42E45|nr:MULTISPECIES: hypothetical protein [Bacillus subtilis group]KIO59852.1 hypothetical protein B4143_2581 [Bacillus subtilis]PAC85332.1 hypothetical protein CHI03_12605 [Bacillus subtilis]PSA99557.1 hypothetical protein C6372_02405 [Bacillus halotolerans]PWI62401.1 hypothetical protein DCS65_03245 [Bacillus subtilis]QAW17340.1 hypothetical protein ETA19_13125 [Bacillus subtilis]
MLNELRNQLWKAMHLNPVWPSDLLVSAKDPDYEQVSFKQINDHLEVELFFTENGDIVKAIYLFDDNEYLQHASIIEGDSQSTIYDRQKEIETILTKIKKLTTSNKITSA